MAIGVVYNTSMTRPDAALALAAMYIMESRKECQMGSVCVAGAGFNAAVFCDIIGKMYTFGPARNGNQALAVGLATEQGTPDSPMVKVAIEQNYPRTIKRVTDTSAPVEILRNGVIFNAESAVILSGPATYLAKTLDLLNVKQLYKDRVKRLVIVDSGTTYNDVPALRRIIAEWPTPIFFLPKETGDALKFPANQIEKAAPPIVDAYKSYKPMPYDASLYDLAATHFAIHPDSGFFEPSAAGTISVANDGAMKFAPGSGNVKSIGIVPAKKNALLIALIDTAAAKPVASGRGAPITPAITPPAVKQ